MTTQLSQTTEDKNLYEQVADQIQRLIAEGTLQAGDRLPSVRKLHEQWSVSVSTVLEAYRLLEDRGLIAVRPQSGYYVKAALHMPSEPQQSMPLPKAHHVDNSLGFQVMCAIRDSQTVRLGAAIPSMDLLPHRGTQSPHRTDPAPKPDLGSCLRCSSGLRAAAA